MSNLMNVLERTIDILKEGKVYSIGQHGLSPVRTGILKLQANQVYSMGASSMPKRIYITKVPDENGIFYYKNEPFNKSKELRGDIKYLEDLILMGTRKELAYLKSSKYKGSYQRNRISRLMALLANKKTHPEKLSDYDRFSVRLKHREDLDMLDDDKLWRAAEMYGGVAGIKNNEGKHDLIVHGVLRASLKMLKRDSRFIIDSIKKE